jgi:hypothetical protein
VHPSAAGGRLCKELIGKHHLLLLLVLVLLQQMWKRQDHDSAEVVAVSAAVRHEDD